MKNHLPRSLTSRFGVILLLTLLGCVILFSSLLFLHSHLEVSRIAKKRAKEIGMLAQSSLSYPLWQLNSPLIQNFSSALLKAGDIVHITVHSTDSIICELSSPVFEQKSYAYFLSNPRFYTLSQRLSYRDEYLGDFRVVIDTDVISASLTPGVEIAVISVLIMAILTYSISLFSSSQSCKSRCESFQNTFLHL